MADKTSAATEIIGPKLDADKFLTKHKEWAAEESEAASEAGERRQAIGQLVEDMNLNNKAASQARAILKMKKDGDRMDAVRSWEQILPMLKAEIMGDQPDMFPENGGADTKVDDAPSDNAVTPIDFAGARA